MTGLLWKNVAKCEGWNLSTSGLWAYGQFTSLSLSADWYLPACTNLSENCSIWKRGREAGAVAPHPQLAKRNWTEKDGVNILAKVLGLVSVSPHRKENKENQRQQHHRTFVKECCQMWRVELVNIWTISTWSIHILVTKPQSADWYLPAWTNLFENSGTWQCRRVAGEVAPAFGSVQWNRKGVNILANVLGLFSVCPRQTDTSLKENQRQQHDGTFVKEHCSIWRVELVNIQTMSICPTHIFVTKRPLILACMNRPFGQLRYLAASQRGKRSCPHIWLSAIESRKKRWQL